jgi:hypothetical protein
LAVLVAVVVLAAAASIAVARPTLGRAMWSSLHAYRWLVLGLSVVAAVVVLGWQFAAFLRQPSGSLRREYALAAAAASLSSLDIDRSTVALAGSGRPGSHGVRWTSGAGGHRVALCRPPVTESATSRGGRNREFGPPSPPATVRASPRR